jgi:hypothetical protein
MNIRDRLMSRASVAVMAAFSPKGEGGADNSKVGQMEQVDGTDSSRSEGDDPLGLSAEEAAQFSEMMNERGAPATDHGGDGTDGADGGDSDGGDADGGEEGEEFTAGAADDAGEGDEGGADGADGAAQREGEQAPAPGEKKPKTVSYGRFKRETDKMQATLQQTQAELAKEREARTRLDERTRLLLEAINTKAAAPQQQEQQQEDPEPDADADPIGNLQWHNRRLAKQVNDLTQGRQREQEETAAQREEREVYSTFESDLQREAAADPEFADAFVHLRETRYRELGFIFADIDITDPNQCALLSNEQQVALSQNIQRSFHNEQMMVAREALKAKKSPAKVVKNLAIARGYAKKAAAAAAPAAPTGAPGRGPAPRGKAAPAAAAAAPSVSEQLEAIRQGASERSLSDGGGSPGGQLTPERLLQMDDEEFEQMLFQNKRQVDRHLGK